LSATAVDEVFDAPGLQPGERRFTDGTTGLDVELLQLGFVSNGAVEKRRNETLQTNRMAVLIQLAGILNAPGCIISRHRRLKRARGEHRPPFFYLGRARREFDGRTPWWISAKRRQSYLNMLVLEQYGTIENVLELLESETVTKCAFLCFIDRTPLRVEIAFRLDCAYKRFAYGRVDIDDPVQDLPSAVRNPEHWCRSRVHGMIIEAAAEGPNGSLAALYPKTLDERLLDMMWKANFVSDKFRNDLLGLPLTPPRKHRLGSRWLRLPPTLARWSRS
jgi:hypothetical protein